MMIMTFTTDPHAPGINALFLDRDGTVIEDRDYLADPDGVALLPGVGQALGRLCAAGVRLFLVTNQSGVGRGYFGEDDIRRCQERLDELLRPFGASFTAVRHCPHAPEEGCSCRKPSTGMWNELAEQYDLNPSRCAMAGDKPDDVRFGVAAGFPLAFLVLTGKGKESAAGWGANLPDGRDLMSLGSEPVPSTGWISMLRGDLKPVSGGTTEQFDGNDGPRSGAPDPETPMDPISSEIWLARDLGAVADMLLSS